jgi:ribokinase
VIVVPGSINLDLTARVERLPKPGETVRGPSFASAPGGKGANQALAARRAGAEVVMIGAVGDDDPRRTSALELLRSGGVDLSHVKTVKDNSTGVALIMVDDMPGART